MEQITKDASRIEARILQQVQRAADIQNIAGRSVVGRAARNDQRMPKQGYRRQSNEYQSCSPAQTKKPVLCNLFACGPISAASCLYLEPL